MLLRQALALADFARLPADMAIDPSLPVPTDPPITSYSLEANGQQQRVSGLRANAPSAIKSRLDRIDQALEAIVAGSVLAAVEVEGVIRVQGNAVLLDGLSQPVIVDDAAAADVLRHFAGRSVKLRGQRAAAGRITDVAILYPQPLKGQTALVAVNGAGDTFAIFGYGVPAVKAFGQGARVLALGDGNEVTFDGYLFGQAQQQPELHVQSVQATMTRFSYQTVNGVITGFVRQGDVVSVDRLSSSGRHARTTDGATTGYVRVDRLRVGVQPTAAIHPPQPSAGMSGALPGND